MIDAIDAIDAMNLKRVYLFMQVQLNLATYYVLGFNCFWSIYLA